MKAPRFTLADVPGLREFIHGRWDSLCAAAGSLTCARDGHSPAARWRGMSLRCFRCQRCGEETKP